jgi:hypothetical protein
MYFSLEGMMSKYSVVQEQRANMDGDNPTNKKKNLQVKNTQGFFCMYIVCNKQRELNIKRHTLVLFLAPTKPLNRVDKQASTGDTVFVRNRR